MVEIMRAYENKGPSRRIKTPPNNIFSKKRWDVFQLLESLTGFVNNYLSVIFSITTTSPDLNANNHLPLRHPYIPDFYAWIL